MDNLPKDPVILLSYINTQLRDNYPSLEELCASLDVTFDELMSRLEPLGVEYLPQINQLR